MRMTREEALEYLDTHCTAEVLPFEVKILCSKALEKQIPKKPTNQVKMFGQRLGQCSCGATIINDWHYCPTCSQEIDWEE